MNINQVGQSMSMERHEHSMDSEMEGIRKGYIYISALLFQIYKKRRDSGTGTTLTGTGTTRVKRGSGHLVSVPHLLVPVPPGEFREN